MLLRKLTKKNILKTLFEQTFLYKFRETYVFINISKTLFITSQKVLLKLFKKTFDKRFEMLLYKFHETFVKSIH